ncbi:MAG: NAD(P)/FAD-dependent oxidoreductase [Actinomyces sp.]|nr:MAG: NAD(P)/FAD-dependent oxidoreductase [Actinomyces sp.]
MTEQTQTAPRVVILGGGTGGTLLANRLRRTLDDAVITVVDRDDSHVYQPGLLFVPFGLAEPERLVRPRHRQLHRGIELRRSEVDRVDLEARSVELADGTALPYDVLVIATGARLLPEETPGLTGPGWGETIHHFYELDPAIRLRDALADFDHGRLVIGFVDLPIKCPVAPLEFAFLADAHLRERGVRDEVEITYVTPLDAPFTKPVAAHHLGGMLAERGIEVVTDFATGEIDGEARQLVSYDDRRLDFDLAVVIPLHGGAAYVERSPGLGDELGFVPADPHTLQSKAAPEVFVIGDAAALPASKAGSVTHFEGEILARNIEHFCAGEPLEPGYDGHANCFIETGFGKAMLIDFNYGTEPLPGRFPGPVGAPLLAESRINHLGKLLFEPVYWHWLLPGRPLPLIGPDMPRRGKAFEELDQEELDQDDELDEKPASGHKEVGR